MVWFVPFSKDSLAQGMAGCKPSLQAHNFSMPQYQVIKDITKSSHLFMFIHLKLILKFTVKINLFLQSSI